MLGPMTLSGVGSSYESSKHTNGSAPANPTPRDDRVATDKILTTTSVASTMAANTAALRAALTCIGFFAGHR